MSGKPECHDSGGIETNATGAILERRFRLNQAEMARNAGSDAVKVCDMDQSKRDGGPIRRVRRDGKWLELWLGDDEGAPEIPNFSCKPDELDYAIESRGLSDFARDHGLFSLSLTLAPNATGIRVISGVSAIVPREMVTCVAGADESPGFTKPDFSMSRTLRDEFAMAALPSLIAATIHSSKINEAQVAAAAYEVADAMMQARVSVEQPARAWCDAEHVFSSDKATHCLCGLMANKSSTAVDDSPDPAYLKAVDAEMHRVAGTAPVVGCRCDDCELKRTEAIPEKYRVPKHQHRYSVITKRCIYCDVPEHEAKLDA